MATLVLTFALTIVFDLVVAIGVGMPHTVVLFMKMVSEETEVKGVGSNTTATRTPRSHAFASCRRVCACDEINGPMFFGDRAHRRHLGEGLHALPDHPHAGVPSLDATGMNALENLYDYCSANGVSLIFSHVNEQPMKTMRRRFRRIWWGGALRSCIDDAIAHARELLAADGKTLKNLMKILAADLRRE